MKGLYLSGSSSAGFPRWVVGWWVSLGIQEMQAGPANGGSLGMPDLCACVHLCVCASVCAC